MATETTVRFRTMDPPLVRTVPLEVSRGCMVFLHLLLLRSVSVIAVFMYINSRTLGVRRGLTLD